MAWPSTLRHPRVSWAPVVDFTLSIIARGAGMPLALAANVVLARVLGPAEFGRYVALLSAGLVAGGIAAHGVGPVLIREIAGRPVKDRAATIAIAGRWTVTVVGPLAVLVTGLLLLWLMAGPGAPSNSWAERLLACLLIPLWTVTVVFSAILTGASRIMQSQLLANLWKNACLLVGVTVIVLLGNVRAETALFVQVLSYLSAVVLGAFLVRRAWSSCRPAGVSSADIALATGETRRWLRAANSFFALSIATLLFVRLDVVVVNALAGEEQAGLFGAAARMSQGVQIVGLVWLAWLQPKLAALARGSDARQVGATLRLGFLGAGSMTVVIAGCGWIFAPQAMAAFGPGFNGAIVPFRLLLVGYVVWALTVPCLALLMMSGCEKPIALTMWGQLALTLAISVPLIRAQGAIGGAEAWAGGLTLGNLALLGVGLRFYFQRRASGGAALP